MRVRLERVLTNDPGHRRRAPRRRRATRSRCATARRSRAFSFRCGAVRRVPTRPVPMLSARFKPWHVPLFLGEVRVADGAPPSGARALRGHAALQRALRLLRLLEDRPPSARADELKSFADAARFFNPMLVTFTGGEPTLRRDLEEHRRRGRSGDRAQVHHADHARRHAHAGARAVAVGRGHQSVQHLARLPRRAARRGARHSRAHGEDLRARFRRCARAASTTSASTPSSRTTTSTRSCRSCDARAELGVGVNFSVYTDAKNGNRDAPARRRRSTRQLDDVVARAARLQAAPARRDHELRLLPRADSALRARRDDASRVGPGMRTIHIDPDGPREALPRFPDRLSLARLQAYEPMNCNACYYACRGEAQAPLRLSRVRDVMA